MQVPSLSLTRQFTTSYKSSPTRQITSGLSVGYTSGLPSSTGSLLHLTVSLAILFQHSASCRKRRVQLFEICDPLLLRYLRFLCVVGLPSVRRTGYHSSVQRSCRWRVRRYHIGTPHAGDLLPLSSTLEDCLFSSDCPCLLSRLWHADISHHGFGHGVLGTFWNRPPDHSPSRWRFPGCEWKRMACHILETRW